MKKTILNSLTVVTLFFASAANAQVGVGVPAENMHPSAELEVKSTKKGFLPPRMTKVERDAIVAPAAGLIVFQTDGDVTSPLGLYFFDGTAWRNGVGETGATGPVGATGPAGKDGKVDIQNFKVSTTGDTLYLTNGNYVIIPSLSLSNPPTSGFGPALVDIDENSYKTVYIGKQQWMAENLKVSKYSDGTTIPNITDNTLWQNNTTGAWSYYNNEVDNNAKYGKLYNWFAVSRTTNGNKNVCPTGWHLPSDDEWTVLLDFIEGDGGKLKKEGVTEWLSPNRFATNTSGFSALPAGFRDEAGNYEQISTNGKWWSSNQNVPFTSNAWYRDLNNGNGALFRSFYDKSAGLSVRCVED
jgi:uncharacterized protein (TIGR02145 family)